MYIAAAPPRTHSRARMVAGAILIVAAVIYLVIVLRSQWRDLGPELRSLDGLRLSGALLLALAMVALKAAYHVCAFRRLGEPYATTPMHIASAYAGGQLARYLPGKVMGLVYQATKMADVPLHRVVAANVIQGLQTLAFTLVVLLSVGAWFATGSAAAGTALAAVGAVAVWAAHRWSLIEHTANAFARRMPWLARRGPMPDPSPRLSLRATAILAAEWVMFLASWALLMPAEDVTVASVALLASCYSAAALAGGFVLLMPSGLVVREAIFLWCGTRVGVDPSSLVVLGLLSRVILSAADLLLPALLWSARKCQWTPDYP